MTVNSSPATAASDTPHTVNGTAAQQKSSIKLDVIVVGAGISGLATAISTALSGHNVTVFESAQELLEVGETITHISALAFHSRVSVNSQRD